jgi:hypothetical protein
MAMVVLFFAMFVQSTPVANLVEAANVEAGGSGDVSLPVNTKHFTPKGYCR